VRGLEGALVDRDFMTVGSLEAEDARSWAIEVAGPAALLVAKVYKIQDRQGTLRLGDKDALDVFRLLRGTSTEELAARFRRVLSIHQATAAPAARWLAEQFGNPRGAGIAMTLRAVGPLADPAEIIASCIALVHDLIREIGD
jgi:hypothetical protein